jgi:hypothetical protein
MEASAASRLPLIYSSALKVVAPPRLLNEDAPACSALLQIAFWM